MSDDENHVHGDGDHPDPPKGNRPYADVDLTELPGWWREAVEHFDARGIGPYRPPRFDDGTLKPHLVGQLEANLDVSIQFRCKNPTVGADWAVLVDGEPVGTIGRHRSRERYTVFEMGGAEFADWIRSAVDSRSSE